MRERTVCSRIMRGKLVARKSSLSGIFYISSVFLKCVNESKRATGSRTSNVSRIYRLSILYNTSSTSTFLKQVTIVRYNRSAGRSSHLLPVTRSVVAHKGGLNDIVVSQKGRGEEKLSRKFYRFFADLPRLPRYYQHNRMPRRTTSSY